VRIVEASGDEHDLMLALEELAACEEATGDLQGALEDTRKVRRHMWAIHRGQTRQLVQQVWEYVDVERDRKKLQTQASEATRSAEEDPLTGLGNRRQLERFLLEESERQTEVACIIADIDFFKDVNDMFGHDVGDAVLRQVGEIFSSKLRAGQKAIRYGGDEFVVVMSGVDLAGACGFAERIRLTVSDFAWTAIAPALRLTISVGVACGPARDWQAAIKSADARLLAAKRAGRNTVVTAPVGLLSA
jgi:diguanylate cyclase (GGDEF)-like protein